MKNKKKSFLLALIFSLLPTYSLSNNEDYKIVDIKIQGSNIFPINVKNYEYGVDNCDKKIKNMTFAIGNNKIIRNIVTKNNYISEINIDKKIIKIKCYDDSGLGLKFIKKDKFDGYVVIDKGYSTYIFDEFGNNIYKRDYKHFIPYFTSINKNGIMTTILYDTTRVETFGDTMLHGLISNDTKHTYIIKYDLKKNKLVKIISPYEIVENTKKYFLTDSHGFHDSGNGYYLISYDVKKLNQVPEYKLENMQLDSNSAMLDYIKTIKTCNSNNIPVYELTPRIVKIDYSGKLIWSYNITINRDAIIVPNTIISSSNKRKICIIKPHHVNHISTDKNDKLISIGQGNPNSFIINSNKEIVASFPNKQSHYISYKDNVLTVENDPVGTLCATHSGYLNEKKQIIYFDNGCEKSGYSRGVIYDLDLNNKKAKFVKSFNLSENKENCSVDSAGRVSCRAIHMGAARFVGNDKFLINWGYVPGSTAVLSIYDSEYNEILEINGKKIGTNNEYPIYASNYYEKEDFKLFIRNLYNVKVDDNLLNKDLDRKILNL